MLDSILAAIQTSTLTQGPTRIELQVQPDHSAKILQIVLSVAVGLLSATTFLFGYRKRIRERRAAWYQKVVVDESLPKLFEFFRNTEGGLFAAVSDCQRSSEGGRKTLSNKVTAAILAFSTQLTDVQNFVAERLIIFDERAAQDSAARFEALQDDVAKWFEDCVVKRRGKSEQMRDILLVAQREILKLLYECEFKNF
jgi:hypothetical protein